MSSSLDELESLRDPTIIFLGGRYISDFRHPAILTCQPQPVHTFMPLPDTATVANVWISSGLFATIVSLQRCNQGDNCIICRCVRSEIGANYKAPELTTRKQAHWGFCSWRLSLLRRYCRSYRMLLQPNFELLQLPFKLFLPFFARCLHSLLKLPRLFRCFKHWTHSLSVGLIGCHYTSWCRCLNVWPPTTLPFSRNDLCAKPMTLRLTFS